MRITNNQALQKSMKVTKFIADDQAKPVIISTYKELSKLKSFWSKPNNKPCWLAVDTETLGLDHYTTYSTTKESTGEVTKINSAITLIQFFDGHYTFILNIPKIVQAKSLDKMLEVVKEIFEDENIVKVFYNASFDIRMLLSFELLPKNTHCLMLGAKLAQENGESTYPSLAKSASRYIEYVLQKEEQLSFGTIEAMQGELTESQLGYAALDVQVMAPIYFQVYNKLASIDSLDAWQMDNYAAVGVAFLERGGLPFSRSEYNRILETEANDHVKCAVHYAMSPLRDINANSSKQIKEHFKTTYDIKLESSDKATLTFLAKKNSGKASDDAQLLLDFKATLSNKSLPNLGKAIPSPLDDNNYSLNTKIELLDIYNTPIENRKQYENASALCGIKGETLMMLSSNYRINGAVTGRFSSTGDSKTKINLQNQKKEWRKAFKVPQGFGISTCDYTAVEMWLMFQLSGEKEMIRAMNEGLDAHKFVASLMMEVPYNEVTPEQRQAAKAIGFGLIYGQSTYAIAEGLECSVSHADNLQKKFFENLPNIGEMQYDNLVIGLQNGYVLLESGRRRYLSLDKENIKRQQYRAATRKISNSPMQGLCSEAMKLAIYECVTKLYDDGMINKVTAGASIHDELSLVYKSEHREYVNSVLKHSMSRGIDRFLPDMDMKMSVEEGRVWSKESYTTMLEDHIKATESQRDRSLKTFKESFGEQSIQYRATKEMSDDHLKIILCALKDHKGPSTKFKGSASKVSEELFKEVAI